MDYTDVEDAARTRARCINRAIDEMHLLYRAVTGTNSPYREAIAGALAHVTRAAAGMVDPVTIFTWEDMHCVEPMRRSRQRLEEAQHALQVVAGKDPGQGDSPAVKLMVDAESTVIDDEYTSVGQIAEVAAMLAEAMFAAAGITCAVALQQWLPPGPKVMTINTRTIFDTAGAARAADPLFRAAVALNNAGCELRALSAIESSPHEAPPSS